MSYGSAGPSVGGGGGIIGSIGGATTAGTLAYTGFQSFTLVLIAAALLLGGAMCYRLAATRTGPRGTDARQLGGRARNEAGASG